MVGPNVPAAVVNASSPNTIVEIAVRPVTVIVTLLPDVTEVGAVIAGAPTTVTVVDAVCAVAPEPTTSFSVYVPAVVPAGTEKHKPLNEPSSPTVTLSLDR